MQFNQNRLLPRKIYNTSSWQETLRQEKILRKAGLFLNKNISII